MLFAAGPLSRFIEANPTIVMLALGFLMMIGMTLIGITIQIAAWNSSPLPFLQRVLTKINFIVEQHLSCPQLSEGLFLTGFARYRNNIITPLRK